MGHRSVVHDRDTALLARTAQALRRQGRTAEADQLDAAVAAERVPERVSTGVVPPVTNSST